MSWSCCLSGQVLLRGAKGQVQSCLVTHLSAAVGVDENQEKLRAPDPCPGPSPATRHLHGLGIPRGLDWPLEHCTFYHIDSLVHELAAKASWGALPSPEFESCLRLWKQYTQLKPAYRGHAEVMQRSESSGSRSSRT
ncbi:hypothetical protein CB1_001507002 [Camelus ferus]|nr:hypothetical protein CB1_001507002 [Camelus ferus]